MNTGWDTHVHMRSRLGEELGPGLDCAFTSLLVALEARGMLDDTAIVVLSEHGRTPLVQRVQAAGAITGRGRIPHSSPAPGSPEGASSVGPTTSPET